MFVFHVYLIYHRQYYVKILKIVNEFQINYNILLIIKVNIYKYSKVWQSIEYNIYQNTIYIIIDINNSLSKYAYISIM